MIAADAADPGPTAGPGSKRHVAQGDPRWWHDGDRRRRVVPRRGLARIEDRREVVAQPGDLLVRVRELPEELADLRDRAGRLEERRAGVVKVRADEVFGELPAVEVEQPVGAVAVDAQVAPLPAAHDHDAGLREVPCAMPLRTMSCAIFPTSEYNGSTRPMYVSKYHWTSRLSSASLR